MYRQTGNIEGEVVVTKGLSPECRPAWSEVTSAGIFTVEPNGRFDRHYHDCDEYWLFFKGRGLVRVGGADYYVEAGDIVGTQKGVEHDVVAVAEALQGFWLEGETVAGGRIGHLHTSEEAARGHQVPSVSGNEL